MNYPLRVAGYTGLCQWLTGAYAVVDRLADWITETLRTDGTVFLCGNGGSAADAQHVAAEYVGRFLEDGRAPLRVVALTTDTSILTAVGNDFGFEQVFRRQLSALAKPGDLVIFHSTSGQSPNLVEAAKWAREQHEAGLGRIGTVALLGSEDKCAPSRLAATVDWPIFVPSPDGMTAQLGHMMLEHLVAECVEERLSHG